VLILQSEEKVTSADLSADGKFAATADLGQVVRVWNLESPAAPIRVINLVGAGTPHINSKVGYSNPVALSGDGALVACAPAREVPARYAPDDGKEVLVISIATGEVVRRHEVPARPVALRFLSDGTLAVGLPKGGVHLHAPDGSPPVLVGLKSANASVIGGTDSVLCVLEGGSKSRLIFRSGKPKPKLVDEYFVAHNGSLLVTASILAKHVTIERGKESTDVPIAAPPRTIAADEDRIVVVMATEILVLSAKDFSIQATIPGDFQAVRFGRLCAGKLVLWNLSQLIDARPSATLVDVTNPAAAATVNVAHRTEVVDVAFLGDEVVTIDKDAVGIGWRDGKPRAVEAAGLPEPWNVRVGKDPRFPQPVRDALKLGESTLVATSAGTLRILDGAGTIAPLAAPALGILRQHLLPLGGQRALAWGNESIALIDVAARETGSRCGGAERVAVSKDGSFFAVLSLGGYVILHPTWCLPMAEQLVHLPVNPSFVDLGLNSEDALVLVTEGGELTVVDTLTLKTVATVQLGKRVRRMKIARDRKDAVAVAFADGTAAEVSLPAAATSKDVGAALNERWNPALSGAVLELMKKNSFARQEGPAEVRTQSGLLKLPRQLAELFSWRTKMPLHGNSPDVWAEVPAVAAFYVAVFKAKNIPKKEWMIDMGNIRFPGTAEPYTEPRGPKGVSDLRGALSDPPPFLKLATVADGEVIWIVAANRFEPDPFVTFLHLPTGTRESVMPLSEMLYRLVFDLGAGKTS
jgi:hypothetical protein